MKQRNFPARIGSLMFPAGLRLSFSLPGGRGVPIFQSLLAGFLAVAVAGCSVVQATSGVDTKDLSVLKVGADRYQVLAEFGHPVVTENDSDGTKVDIFKIVQGTSKGSQAGRAVGYGVLAVATFGFSEVVTSPVEGTIAKGAEVQLKVGYDSDNKVDEIYVLKDDRWLNYQVIQERWKTEQQQQQSE